MITEYALDAGNRTEGAAVTVGTFDGVHLGHQQILDLVILRARERQAPAVAVTFDPHPRSVVSGTDVPLLTTINERERLFAERGIDRMVVVPFTPAFSSLSGAEFVRQVLVETIGMGHIVIGHDHGFGKGRDGGSMLLHELGAQLGFGIDTVGAEVVRERAVSSSRIRKLLAEEGDVAGAAAMLGRPYKIYGEVRTGQARGRSIGFPTANLEPDSPSKLVPLQGVYAVDVRLPDGRQYGGMLNIGIRPTFSLSSQRFIEVHLLKFSGNLYDLRLVVRFAGRIRDERRFESIDSLRDQLRRDQSTAREVLSKFYAGIENT